MYPWEANVRRVEPYTPGEQPQQPDMIKLNTNENPYPPSPAVIKALNQLSEGGLRRYPDPAISRLREAIARRFGLTAEEVFVGVGSDDVLAMSFLAFFHSDQPILFPDITYSFYDVWAELFGIPFRKVKLDPDFCLIPEDYFVRNGGIIFPNPNAPTGIEMGQDMIRQILDHNRDVVVIVDEAYVDFGGITAAGLLAEYDNLLVVQTFSKSRSLAGMRIGYALGNPALIRYLSDVKYSFNSYTLNQPSLVGGLASIEDETYFRDICAKVIETRERTKTELSRLGFHFPDSMANFIFASHKTVSAKELFHALRDAHIYVRYFPVDRIDNYLRISIGTPEEMERLFAFLRQYPGIGK